jgi:hypothetical protein
MLSIVHVWYEWTRSSRSTRSRSKIGRSKIGRSKIGRRKIAAVTKRPL